MACVETWVKFSYRVIIKIASVQIYYYIQKPFFFFFGLGQKPVFCHNRYVASNTINFQNINKYKYKYIDIYILSNFIFQHVLVNKIVLKCCTCEASWWWCNDDDRYQFLMSIRRTQRTQEYSQIYFFLPHLFSSFEMLFLSISNNKKKFDFNDEKNKKFGFFFLLISSQMILMRITWNVPLGCIWLG